MSVVRFCSAAGCREVIPVGQYFCKKHQYLQKEYEDKRKHWQRDNYKKMTKEQKHEYNRKVYTKSEWKEAPKLLMTIIDSTKRVSGLN